MTPEARYGSAVDGGESPYNEPPWIERLNELGEVLERVTLALRRPERFSTEQLQSLAGEIRESAKRRGVFEPID